MKLPVKIEFEFIESKSLEEGIAPSMLSTATIHFKEKEDGVALVKASEVSGIEGTMECFIWLEHAVRAYLLRECFKEETKREMMEE